MQRQTDRQTDKQSDSILTSVQPAEVIMDVALQCNRITFAVRARCRRLVLIAQPVVREDRLVMTMADVLRSCVRHHRRRSVNNAVSLFSRSVVSYSVTLQSYNRKIVEGCPCVRPFS